MKYINTTPHSITFWSGNEEDEPYSIESSGVTISAKPTEIEVPSQWPGVTTVRTQFVPSEDGLEALAKLEAENPGAIIVGSIIAARAYPGRIVAMVPCKGFERVPPTEKRMRPDKFTIFPKRETTVDLFHPVVQKAVDCMIESGCYSSNFGVPATDDEIVSGFILKWKDISESVRAIILRHGEKPALELLAEYDKVRQSVQKPLIQGFSDTEVAKLMQEAYEHEAQYAQGPTNPVYDSLSALIAGNRINLFLWRYIQNSVKHKFWGSRQKEFDSLVERLQPLLEESVMMKTIELLGIALESDSHVERVKALRQLKDAHISYAKRVVTDMFKIVANDTNDEIVSLASEVIESLNSRIEE